MHFGIIYTDNKNFTPMGFIIKKPLSEFKKEDGIPLLIIGKKNAETLFGEENVKVLNKEICDGIFWTYSKMEKRSEFEKDINSFYEYVKKRLFKTIKYKSINIYNLTFNEVKKILTFIKFSKKEKNIFITNNSIYISYCNNVIGISMDEIDYIGIKKDKIISMIKANNSNFIIHEDNKINSIKRQLNNCNFIIPYLFSK
jgi:hypothetical protein